MRRRPRHPLVALALAAACVLATLAVPAAAQSIAPGLGIRLTEAPAALADDPRAQVYVIDHLVPGATIERVVEVSNGTDDAMEVQLYAADASVDDGWVVADGRGVAEPATWTTVTPSTVLLEAGERRPVTVTIAVPGDAGGGERYAAIVAEAPAIVEGNVEVINRVGIRVYLSVGGGPAPETDFEIDTFTAGRDDEGTPFVLVGVTNTGGRAVDVSGSLLLEAGSLRAGPFDVAFPVTIGPGDDATLTVPMDPDIPAGPWEATVDLSSGLVERSARATLTFPDTAGELGDPVDAERIQRQRRILLPVASILLFLLVLALATVLATRRRAARDDEPDPDGDDGSGGPDEPDDRDGEPATVG
ncbi:MAG: hypothetical protein ACLGIR_12225 [Actinomycetes bacterium]